MSRLQGPIAAQRERNARLRETAERIAERVDIRHARGPLPVAVVPANTRSTEALPITVRQAFLDRLQGNLAQIQAADGAGPEHPRVQDRVAQDAVVQAGDVQAVEALDESAVTRTAILGRSCATCRGECCTAGGDHGFLRRESLVRIRREHPALDDHDLYALYVSHIPERHYRGSCLFHATTGCTLPRTLRSDLCNRYVCGGLTQLSTALDATGGTAAFVAAADSVHLRRMSLIEGDRSTPVALSP